MSELLQRDIEALIEALRKAEDGTQPEEPGAVGYPCVAVRVERWERVLEKRDLLIQSYTLARARAAEAERESARVARMMGGLGARADAR